MTPPPPSRWRQLVTKRFRVNTTSSMAAVESGGRPVLHVVRGEVAHAWRETRAFRRRAAPLRTKLVRARWRRSGWTGTLPPNPYTVPRDDHEVAGLRASG